MSETNPPVSTGSGDEGTTTLLGGGQLAKDDERISLLGEIDDIRVGHRVLLLRRIDERRAKRAKLFAILRLATKPAHDEQVSALRDCGRGQGAEGRE